MCDPVGPEVRRDLRPRFTKKRPPKDASEGVVHLSSLRFFDFAAFLLQRAPQIVSD
jgi:hypothetical protein